MELKDSGERFQYESGAVRDLKEGKGRCDLLPLRVINNFLFSIYPAGDQVIGSLRFYNGSTKKLYEALQNFVEENYANNPYTAILELSHHFEDGAKKYGEYNWQKGIPESSYLDSAIRHYLKFKAGWKDEPHDRAFMWNIVCLIWTIENKKEKEVGRDE